MLSGVSTSGGTSAVRVQLGDSGGVETSGYLGSCSTFAAGTTTATFGDGFQLAAAAAGATDIRHGRIVLDLVNSSTNTWAASAVIGLSSSSHNSIMAGTKALSGTLDRLRLTIDGILTFDAGEININYE